MTHTTLFSQLVGMVVTLACGMAMAQERSVAGHETGSPASQPASTRSTAAPVCRWRDTTGDGNPDETLYYLTDAQMNVTALTDPNGQVVERYVYDAYGQPTILDANRSPITWSNSRRNEILYCGYRYDPETGNYHVRNREYDPALGVWRQADPAGFVDGMNLHQYVESRAINYVDPSGLQQMLGPGIYPNVIYSDNPYKPYEWSAGHGKWGQGGYEVAYEWSISAMSQKQTDRLGIAKYAVFTTIKVVKGPKCPCDNLLWITWGAVYVGGQPYTPPGGRWPWVGIDRYTGGRSDSDPYTFGEAEQVKVNGGNAYGGSVSGVYAPNTTVTPPGSAAQAKPSSGPASTSAPAARPADSVFVDAASTSVKEGWNHELVTCLICRRQDGKDCKIGCLRWSWSPNNGSPAGKGRAPTHAEMHTWEQAVKGYGGGSYAKAKYAGDCE
jgi:RHS repeat-associated protein